MQLAQQHDAVCITINIFSWCIPLSCMNTLRISKQVMTLHTNLLFAYSVDIHSTVECTIYLFSYLFLFLHAMLALCI
jgi:hypothetical protein